VRKGRNDSDTLRMRQTGRGRGQKGLERQDGIVKVLVPRTQERKDDWSGMISEWTRQWPTTSRNHHGEEGLGRTVPCGGAGKHRRHDEAKKGMSEVKKKKRVC